MTPYFEQTFHSGAIFAPWSPPYGSQLFVMVQNPTSREETVRALGYRTNGQWFDSDVDFDAQAGPADGRIPAHGLWVYPRRVYEDESRLVWFEIWSTSARLVPSVQLFEVTEDGGLPRPVGFEWISPGDFAIRRNPFKLQQPDVVGSTDIGPLRP